jgi:hypothetical protein
VNYLSRNAPTIVASLAVAISLWAAFTSHRNSREIIQIEKSRDESELEIKNREQVDQISVWCDPSQKYNTNPLAFTVSVSAFISNQSVQPIDAVVLTWWKNDRPLRNSVIGMVPPALDRQPIQIALPSQYHNRAMSGTDGKLESFGTTNNWARSNILANRLRVSIAFIDANQRRWIKYQSGKLEVDSRPVMSLSDE